MNTIDLIRMESKRLPVEQGTSMTADEEAARLNRYSLELHRLESATPRLVVGQVLEAIESADGGFDVFVADAIKRNDEKLVGKLVIAALTRYRHKVADEVAA